MKLFGLHIMKQKTLDDMFNENTRVARKQAIVMPNKMISSLLRRIYGDVRKTKPLSQALQEAQMALNRKVLNG